MRALAVVALALAFAPAALASEGHPSQAELEGELVCPTCHTTLDQSNAPVAARMKQFIRQRIVAQFGKGVLAAPEQKGFDLLAWVLPIVGLLAGAAALTLLLWRWTHRPEDELPLLE